MISRYNVWINDTALSEIDPQIYINDISYQATSPAFTLNRIASADGQHSGNPYIKDNKITVSFTVRAYNTSDRQNIIQSVIAWASQGGWLKTSDRTGQRIYVKPTRYPSVASAMRWLDELSIEFTAYDYPFWTDENPVTQEMEVGNEYDVYVPGLYKTAVEATVIATEAMTNIVIECGDTTIELDGFSVPAGQPVTISYTDDHHILQIESGGTSLLAYRTPESNDDLILNPGNNAVFFDSDADATCTLYIKGVYL